MSANSIYEVPETLQRHVLTIKGIAEYPSTEAQIRERATVLDRLRSQWESIVDSAEYGKINDLFAVRLAGNGRLVTEWRVDHNYSGQGALVALPYRFITPTLAQRYLAEYIGWLEVKADDQDVDDLGRHQNLYIVPANGTSNLRVRAFETALRSANEQVGSLVTISTFEGRVALRLKARELYDDSVGYIKGIQLHQMFWALAVAKELRDNLMTLMREALRMHRNEDERAVVKRDTSQSFEKFFADRLTKIRAVATRASIENLPIIEPAEEITPRTWGIEVEAAGARGVRAPADDWERKGDGSLRSAYNGNHTQRIPEDCPYHEHDNDFDDYCEWLNFEDYDDDDYDDYGGDTAEFVSPILNTAGDANLKKLLADLQTQPQNDSAGVHVHVDASDLTPRNVGSLVFAYSIIEPIIEQAYRRNVRNYCRERPAADVLNVVKSSKKPGILKSYRDGGNRSGTTMYHGDRYHSVNLNALEAHGTIEFRSMGPVYDYGTLIKWALFVREMVSIAKLNLPPKVWTSVKDWNDLEKVLYKYGTELPADRIRKMEASLAEKKVKVTA